MNLRTLELKDAEFMLEWMHDKDIVNNLQAEFDKMTLYDCKNFIMKSYNYNENYHLAIVDDNDEYMGTVSLKNLTSESAEFAIVIRKSAMGKGFSRYGMQEIIRKGFEEFKLKKIYWCVAPENIRAVKFYEKNGYENCDSCMLHDLKNYNEKQIQHYKWYCVNKK